MKKVSILVPVYNVERYIEKCAVSLFEQTYENIEYVFINDCTKDLSIDVLNDVLKNYPQRFSQVKIISHETNRGVAAARNTGIDNSSGDYLMYVDSDDYIEKNMVELLVQKAEEDQAEIVVCDFFKSYENREFHALSFYTSSPKEYLKKLLIREVESVLWAKLYEASFYKKSGARFIEGIDYGEDFLVLLQLFTAVERISYKANYLYHYTLSNNASLTKNITVQSVENIVKINTVICEKFGESQEFSIYAKLSILRSKLSLIKQAKPHLYKLIIPLYEELEREFKQYLKIGDRLLIFLERLRIPFLIYLYCRFGLYMKSK